MANEVQKALALAQQIEKKVADLLEPLERDMKIMGWSAEYRAIMWSAVGNAAFRREAETHDANT